MNRIMQAVWFSRSLRLARVGIVVALALACAERLGAQTGGSESQAGQHQEGEWIERVLRVQVLEVDGTPSSGTTVMMKGLSRENRGPSDPQVEGLGWSYRADAAGKLSIRFAGIRQAKRPDFPLEVDDVTPPCRGRYRLFTAPAGAETALGPSMWMPESLGPARAKPGDLIIREAETELTLQKARGIVLEGVVVNEADRPCSGVTVRIFHDLHMDSHTGRGGEIWERSTRTGEDGRYRFEGIYPAEITVWVDRPWLRTRLEEHGEWIADRKDVIDPAGRERVFVGVGIGAEKQFRYFGTVVDEQGAPVPGINVVLSINRHSRDGYADSHSFAEGVTDAAGRWSISIDVPWVNFIFTKENSVFKRAEMGLESEDLSPGEYQIVTKRQ